MMDSPLEPLLTADFANMNIDPLERLQQCRHALGGVNVDGKKIHTAMFDPGVISLAHGDGTRRPPVEALTAGVEAILDPSRCALDDYLFLQSFEPLEQRISQMYLSGGIPATTANNVCIECGTTRLFGAFMHSMTQPGDVFLVAPTYYHSLPDWCDRFGVSLACVQTKSETGYKLTVPDLERWYRAYVDTGYQRAPRGIFLFNPTQTGALYTAEELAELARFIVKKDLLVLADHVFERTEFPDFPRAEYLAAQEGMAERVVTVGGVSKSHNLANIRIGWACGPVAVIEAMRRYSVSTIISVPRLNMIMALAALSAPAAYFTKNARECSQRVELISNVVDEWNERLALHRKMPAQTSNVFRLVHRPYAGHSLLLSCEPLKGAQWAGGTIRNSVDVTRFFLSEAGVAVSPAFSSGLDGCEVRLCFGSIGLASTYAHSSKAELAAVTRAVADISCARGMSTSVPKGVVDQMNTAAPNTADPFKEGREQLRVAMIDRMLPAMSRLFTAKNPGSEKYNVTVPMRNQRL